MTGRRPFSAFVTKGRNWMTAVGSLARGQADKVLHDLADRRDVEMLPHTRVESYTTVLVLHGTGTVRILYVIRVTQYDVHIQ